MIWEIQVHDIMPQLIWGGINELSFFMSGDWAGVTIDIYYSPKLNESGSS